MNIDDNNNFEEIQESKEEFNKTEEVSLKSKKKSKGIVGVLSAIGLILLKFKALILILLGKFKLVFVVLKLGKFAGTFISMLFMIVIYAQMYGWKFAVGFVLLLFAHEMGHYLVARIIKLKVSTPLFIPFFGALISMKEMPNDVVSEAKVALGGPVLGSIASLICFLVYLATGQKLYEALTYTGLFLNLFNLLPMKPIDGGRILSAVSPKIWIVGIPASIYAIIKFESPILVLILILGIMDLIAYYKGGNKEYYNINIKTKIVFATAYILLAGLLVFGMHVSFIKGYAAI